MSHYDWLGDHLVKFLADVGLDTRWYHEGLIGAHGDKAYSYRDEWEQAGIPFNHGVAIFLLSYCKPFREEVRKTDESGRWINAGDWVRENYSRFKEHLPDPSEEKEYKLQVRDLTTNEITHTFIQKFEDRYALMRFMRNHYDNVDGASRVEEVK